MKLTDREVQRYFDRSSKQWDEIYSGKHGLRYFINLLFRQGLFKRYDLTFEHCGSISGARVLDIGCGTGRYSIEFAKRGAARVVGLDFAPEMVKFSRQKAEELGVGKQCEFICADFMAHTFTETFDIVVAMGFFDYIQAPGPVLQKIASLTERQFLATFPKDSWFWGSQRKVRYHLLKKCPVYFYTQARLEQFFKPAKFHHFNILPHDRGYFCIGINS